MSDTPRTDKEIESRKNTVKTAEGWLFRYRMMTKLAEQLETELNEAKSILSKIVKNAGCGTHNHNEGMNEAREYFERNKC